MPRSGPAATRPGKAALLLALVILALLAGGVWSLQAERERHHELAADELQAIGSLKANQIAEWRAERLGDAQIEAASTGLIAAAARYLQRPTPADEAELTAHFEVAREAYRYRDVMLVRTNGQVALSLTGELQVLGEEAKTALAQMIRDRRPVLTDLHLGPGSMPAHLDSFAPVVTEGRVVGAIVNCTDPQTLLFPLIQSWPVPSETAESLLVRREGDEVLFLNELRHRQGSALSLRIPVSRTDLPAAMAIAGTRGIVEGLDYRGVPVVASLQAVDGSDWALVAKVDRAEIFAEWGRQAILTWAMVIAMVLALCALAAVLWHREAQELLRQRLDAAEQLAAGEERYRATLMSIGDGVIVTDAEGKVQICNAVAAALTGWPMDEAEGQPMDEVFRIVNEYTREVVESPVDKVLCEGGVVGLANHTLLLARDGHELPIADSGAPIHRADGTVAGVVLVFRDQTQERETERVLTENERLLREAQSIAGVGSYVLDIPSSQWDSSAVLDSIFGIGDDYARTVEGWGGLMHPEDTESMLAYLVGDVFVNGKFDRQYRIVRQTDGAERWVHGKGHVEYGEDGAPLRMVGTIEDITDRLLAEEALQRQADVDAALAELSAELLKPEATVDQMAEATLRHARELTASDHGFASSIDAKTGDNVLLCWTTMDGEACRLVEPGARVAFGRDADGRYAALWGHALNQREPVVTNDPDSHPASVGIPEGHVPVRSYLSVPVIAEDELIGQIAVANSSRDYTADDVEVISRLAALYGLALRDRRLRATLLDSEQQLRQAQRMEAVGRLAGGVAHDFNNMLQTMLGNAEIALLELEPDSEVSGYVEEIIKAGQRSAALTNQLLAFARQQTINPRLLDLNEVVAGTLRMLGRLIGEDINLVWRPAPRLGPVLMDPAQVDQILANLVVNSRDAIAGVGTITIETGEAVIDADSLAADDWRVPGRHVVLSISDDGCGMDKETVAKVFEPFFTTKAVGKGTGLGLATVYGIVKQNEGFINVYSEPGQGTTIRIYLPWQSGELREAEEVSARSELPGGSETVLLVEDEASLLLLAQRMLTQLGYTVLTAGSPEDALRIAQTQSEPIHLVITDVVMPGMSGRDLWQCLLDLRPGLKCLYMSGYTADVISQRGVLDEGVHFLSKPFSMETLADQVRTVLRSPAAPR